MKPTSRRFAGGHAMLVTLRRIGSLSIGVGTRWRGEAILAVLIVLPGCFSPPWRDSELVGNPPMPTVASGVSADGTRGGLATDGWKRTGDVDPVAALSKGRRVVVTEFNVEFVDYQLQLPMPRQIRFKGPPISLNPFHMAVKLIGIGRRYSRLDQDRQQALALELHTAFLQDLRRRGLVLVTPDELQASPAYADLRKKAVVGTSPLMLMNIVGNDTGVALHMRTTAAPGLCVLRVGPHARAEAESRILQETRADVALAVRLRVGTFREQPALERRSVMRLTTCGGSTTLRACHSLVSDVAVIEDARLRPFVGRVESIAPGTFSGELTAMLPRFIALALAEPRP